MTVPSEVREFMDSFMGRSPKTRENYDSFVKVFWGFVGNKSAKDVTIEDIMAFLNDGVKNHGWKTATVNQYATLCQIFISEFHDEAFKKKLHRALRTLPKVQSHQALYEGIYVPPDKIDEFIAHAPSEEWAVLYTMILKWGFRLGEAIRVAPVDIDVVKNRVVIRGKGFGGFGKVRQVFVEKSTITRVLQFAGCSQEQMLGQKPIRDINPIIKTLKERTAEYQWKLTAKKSGLKNWKTLTPHDGRHSYAIDFLIKRKKEGMSALVMLKNQLGHTSIQTTTIYLDIAGAEAQDVFDAGVSEVDKNG